MSTILKFQESSKVTTDKLFHLNGKVYLPNDEVLYTSITPMTFDSNNITDK